MCAGKSKCGRASGGGDSRAAFFRHLRAYILVNALVVFGGPGYSSGWMTASMLWGVGVFLHYLNVFGWPEGKRSPWERKENELVDELELPEPEAEQRPEWRDKDLV